MKETEEMIKVTEGMINKTEGMTREPTRKLNTIVNYPVTATTLGPIVLTIPMEKVSKEQQKISLITTRTDHRKRRLLKPIISVNLYLRDPKLCLGWIRIATLRKAGRWVS